MATFKFGDFVDLKKKIDFYLGNDQYREVMRRNAFAQTKNRYTYKKRWAQILEEIGL